MEQGQGNALARLTASFEGKTVTTIERKGDALFLPREVALALEMADPDRFAERLTVDLVEGRHFVKIGGAEMSALKAALPGIVDPRAARLVLLTEAGLYRALMRSRAPRAEAFQEWLASELLPRLAKTGRYELPAKADQIEDDEPTEDTAMLPVAPSLLQSRTRQHMTWLVELRARGSISPEAFSTEVMSAMGAQVLQAEEPRGLLPWVPTPPAFELAPESWPLLAEGISRWTDAAIQADLRWVVHRVIVDRNPRPSQTELAHRYRCSKELVGRIFNQPAQWSDPRHLESWVNCTTSPKTHWAFRPRTTPMRFETGIVTARDWPALREAFGQPWPGLAASLDARCRRARQERITLDGLAEVWGWEVADARRIVSDLVFGGVA